jgi:hypothetical protein
MARKVIGRFEPTSQVCSACGIKDGPKPLSVREWTCAARWQLSVKQEPSEVSHERHSRESPPFTSGRRGCQWGSTDYFFGEFARHGSVSVRMPRGSGNASPPPVREAVREAPSG